MRLPSGQRADEVDARKLAPVPQAGADDDDLSINMVDEDTSPMRLEREQAVGLTRAEERRLHMPRGYRTWEEVARARDGRIGKVKKAADARWEQSVLSKPLKIAIPKPPRAVMRAGSTIATAEARRRAQEIQMQATRWGNGDFASMEAPRAVTEIKQRKSLRLARVAAQIRRALATTLSERKVRDPALYPMGLPVQVVEVEVTPDLRVARVRWQLPLSAAGASTGRDLMTEAAVAAAAAEWERRASGALERGPLAPRVHPFRRRREGERRRRADQERAAVRSERARGLRAAGVPIAADDSDLDWEEEAELEELGLAGSPREENPSESPLQLRRAMASPEVGFGRAAGGTAQAALAGVSGAEQDATNQFWGRAADARAQQSRGAAGIGRAAPGSLSWRIDQRLLRRQLAQWRSDARTNTVKPTLSRVMRWAEEAAVPSDPLLRASFKSTRDALERCAPALRVHVAAQVPLRLSPRLEFHAWVGVQPAELLNAARRGMVRASSLSAPITEPDAASTSARDRV